MEFMYDVYMQLFWGLTNDFLLLPCLSPVLCLSLSLSVCVSLIGFMTSPISSNAM